MDQRKKGGIDMKAPDKIYINVTPLGVDYSIVPIPDFGGVEYIRKDALLEWTKEQASITEKLNGKGAMLKAWDTLIDKIESL